MASMSVFPAPALLIPLHLLSYLQKDTHAVKTGLCVFDGGLDRNQPVLIALPSQKQKLIVILKLFLIQ